VLRIRPRRRRDGVPARGYDIPLPQRSLYVMSGECRYEWEHCIPRFGNAKHTRISLVFRKLTDVNAAGMSSTATPTSSSSTLPVASLGPRESAHLTTF
jgi:hypothetical protein